MKRVLIVDDHSEARKALRDFFEWKGYTCREVTNGALALGILGDEQFDLVMTDYEMPEMNGLRLLQHLNEQQKKQSMPVVLLSGCITGELRDAALKAGATAVLKKPWNLGELISEVNRILEHR